VKVPLDTLTKLLEERARLGGGRSSRERVLELHGNISSQRSRGSAALSSEALHRWVVLQELRARLEMALSDMLSCIHALFNQQSSSQTLGGLSEYPLLWSLFGRAACARDAVRHAEFRWALDRWCIRKTCVKILLCLALLRIIHIPISANLA
jgi:hypothetical protein